MSRRLLELARLAETTVTIDGETLRVREPNGLEMMEYRARRVTDLEGALAHLIHHCVIDTDGKPIYTEEEAKIVAGGHASVILPLVTKLLSFTRTTEKKSSPPKSDSGTDSP